MRSWNRFRRVQFELKYKSENRYEVAVVDFVAVDSRKAAFAQCKLFTPPSSSNDCEKSGRAGHSKRRRFRNGISWSDARRDRIGIQGDSAVSSQRAAVANRSVRVESDAGQGENVAGESRADAKSRRASNLPEYVAVISAVY